MTLLVTILAAAVYLFLGVVTGRALVCLFAGADTDDPAGLLVRTSLFLAGLIFWPFVMIVGLGVVFCTLTDGPA